MSVTRSVSDAHIYAQKISENYIMPLDDESTASLSTQMLVAAMNHHLKNGASAQDQKPLFKTIKILGTLFADRESVFQPDVVDQNVPKKGFLKNIAGGKVSLRKAKIVKYSDFKNSFVPYLVCDIPDLSTMPIDIDLSAFKKQMKRFRHLDTPDSSTRVNQLCTWGAFVTTFHRDTMFSRKVHTLSPGSLKLWCFEQCIGQLDIENLGNSHDQMRLITSKPAEFDFFLQEPGMVVEHLGGYAHLVVTYNRCDSSYGQWCALIGWEINTSRQINHCMRVETPLVQVRGGTLDAVSVSNLRAGCN